MEELSTNKKMVGKPIQLKYLMDHYSFGPESRNSFDVSQHPYLHSDGRKHEPKVHSRQSPPAFSNMPRGLCERLTRIYYIISYSTNGSIVRRCVPVVQKAVQQVKRIGRPIRPLRCATELHKERRKRFARNGERRGTAAMNGIAKR